MSHKRSPQSYTGDSAEIDPNFVITDEVKATLEQIQELWNTGKGKQLNADGAEVLDPRPLAPPIGYVKQPSMVDHIRNLVRSHMLAAAAEAADAETFEDADDFDVEDELNDPHTPYEAVFDPPALTLPEAPAAAAGGAPKPPETPSGAVATETAPPPPNPIPAAGS